MSQGDFFGLSDDEHRAAGACVQSPGEIRSLRQSLGLSARAFASRFGLDYPTLLSIESGSFTLDPIHALYFDAIRALPEQMARCAERRGRLRARHRT